MADEDKRPSDLMVPWGRDGEDLSPSSLSAHASLATGPVWDPGLSAMGLHDLWGPPLSALESKLLAVVREALKAAILHCREAAFWFLLLLPLSLARSFQASPCCSPLPLHSGATMATISQSLSTGSPGSVIGLHLWAYGAALCCEPGVLPPCRARRMTLKLRASVSFLLLHHLVLSGLSSSSLSLLD